MKIEHIAMYVNDLERAKDFLLNILMAKQIMVITTEQLIFVLIL